MIKSEWKGSDRDESGVAEFIDDDTTYTINFLKFSEYYAISLLLEVAYQQGYGAGMNDTKQSILKKLNKITCYE